MNTSEVHVTMCLRGRTCVFVVDLLVICCKAHYQAERTPHMTQLQPVHYVQCVSAVMPSFLLCAHNNQWLTKQKKSSTPLYIVTPAIQNSS